MFVKIPSIDARIEYHIVNTDTISYVNVSGANACIFYDQRYLLISIESLETIVKAINLQNNIIASFEEQQEDSSKSQQ
jgi:hypothetical protein